GQRASPHQGGSTPALPATLRMSPKVLVTASAVSCAAKRPGSVAWIAVSNSARRSPIRRLGENFAGGVILHWFSGTVREAAQARAFDLYFSVHPAVVRSKSGQAGQFIRETIEFNTTSWFRVPGYFYFPRNVPLPAPALLVLHEWGGPMLFGADRGSGEPV